MNIIRGINKVIDYRIFTYREYEKFLEAISRFRVLPLCEFQHYHNNSEVVIGLRHDIDTNLNSAFLMKWCELKYNIRSTWFVLHTARYYKRWDLITLLRWLQERGHEIGFHNNLMTVKDPEIILKSELTWLRSNGIKITGTAAHGVKGSGIDNKDFWKDHNLSDFGLEYEAYSLNFNKYFSDCTFISSHRWHPNMFDWSSLKPGNRIQILIHSNHWHK